MFTTLRAGSLEEVDIQHGPVDKLVLLVTGKPRNSRSRHGCVSCRQRKKKCDEQRPCCSRCTRGHLSCVYETKKKMISSLMRTAKIMNAVPIQESALGDLVEIQSSSSQPENRIIQHQASPTSYFLASDSESFESYLVPASSYSNLVLTRSLPKMEELDEFGHPIRDLRMSYEEDAGGWSSPSILKEPTPCFQMILTDRELGFLQLFQTQIAQQFVILPSGLPNHFRDSSLLISHYSEASLRIVTAWGALTMRGPDEVFSQLLAKAFKAARAEMQRSSTTAMDRFVLTATMILAASLGNCGGDTSEWYYFHEQSVKMIKEFGLIRQFLECFGYLRTARWLVSTIQYHDVMSLAALKRGTLVDMNEFADLFHDASAQDYGFDSIQGCIQLVFSLLGEIFTVCSTLQAQRTEIEDQIQGMMGTTTSEAYDVFQTKRLLLYLHAISERTRLMEKVNLCQPIQTQQSLLDSEELEQHLTIFEAFRNTCKLVILLYIDKVCIKAPEVQMTVLHTFKLLDELILCPLRSATSMVLLICGFSCAFVADRNSLLLKFDKLLLLYNVLNVRMVKRVVEQSWLENPDGDHTVSWMDMCEKLGWQVAAT